MDLEDESLEGRLLFAVPKKGRLQKATLDLLAGSDIQFNRETRLDIALVINHNIALVFLPAADIPTVVGEGRVDLGITGRDQVSEHEATSPSTEYSGVEEVLDLDFGKCRLQVQVPIKSGISDPRELVGKTVVTSFVGLTEHYFARLEGHEVQNDFVNRSTSASKKRQLKTKIRYMGGSVEAACRLGVGDGIVDLVESGQTMKAAKLKAIDTVIASTAVLIKSKHSSNEKLVNLIASRIAGVITAQKYVLCQYNIPRSKLDIGKRITPGKRAPTVQALEGVDWVAVSSMVEAKRAATVMDELISEGATDVLILDIKNTRTK